MSRLTSGNKLANSLAYLVAAILALLPFHAFLTVWLASAAGHYTALRLWKEFLLVILVFGVAYFLIKDARLRKNFFAQKLSLLIGIYSFVCLIWGSGAYLLNDVSIKALGYGLIVDLRFLIFFLCVYVIAAKSQILKNLWPKLLFIPAAIVTVIGILQRLVLPLDFLNHFGYNSNTIFPYETINHNIHYRRVMSTLRGANPLGAYMNLIISALAVLFIKVKKNRFGYGVFGIAAFAALFFSYSREAWIGVAVSLFLLGLITLRKLTQKRMLAIVLAILVIAAGSIAAVVHENKTFQNLVLHTQDGSAVSLSSNQQHVSAFRNGLHDLTHDSLGKGVGTAGPASVYNKGQARIAENYFIQVGQETGWLGFILFILINYFIVLELWRRRADNLALILLISLAGISFSNLFSYAWADDTLSYIWWGLAGIALAPAILGVGKQNAKIKNKA